MAETPRHEEIKKRADDWRERCRVCDAPITSAQLCAKCAEGNDPLVSYKHRGDYFR